MNYKTYNDYGYDVNILSTNKFKSTKIKVTFASDLRKQTVTNRAVLAYVMRTATTKYPTRAKLTEQLEGLYSTYFSAYTEKRGLTHFITFEIQVVNNEFALFNENLQKEVFELLHEIVYHPLFTEQTLQEELRLLEEYHLNTYNNKLRYTIKKTLEEVYKDDPYQISAIGLQEDLKSITLHELKETYQDMIDNDLLTITVVSSIDAFEILNNVYSNFKERHTTHQFTLVDTKRIHNISNQSKELVQDVKQSKLVIAYDTNCFYLTDDYYKMAVFNSLLGGSSESLLFNRVREELSLCYFIGSVYDQYKGSMVIYAGIDHFQKEVAIQEIDSIISKIQNGQIKDSDLELTKTTVINSYLESFDSLSSLTTRAHDINLFHRPFDNQKVIDEIKAVTIEDLQQVSQKLVKQITVELRGEHNE